MNLALDILPICSIQDLLNAGSLIAFNVGPDEVIYLVLALNPLDYRYQGDSFPKTVPSVPQRYRVVGIRTNERVLDFFIEQEKFNIHDVQPLGDDIVLVCARSRNRGRNDFDLNGRIYDRDGVFVREVLLGDGIASTQATSRGELWAAYFDEGIFGNFGWNDPIGASGLVAWNGRGEKLYEYDPVGRADPMADCYALNVETDDDVWCCYYMDFPLVHLRNRKIKAVWQVPVHGSHAFAIADGWALFAGDYDDRDNLQLLRLRRDRMATAVAKFEPRNEDGEPIKADRTIGRAGSLYLLSNGTVYQVNLREVYWRYL